MKVYYQDGFYLEDGIVPQGAIEITEQEYVTLIEGQSSGLQIVEDDNGYPVLTDPAPSPYHKYKDEKWVITPENNAKLLADTKALKLTEINAKAQQFVAQVANLDETPDFEQQTWQEQANEARAWYADKSTPTPKLDLIAALRGVPPEVLRQKCYEKAQAFYQLSFAVAGQRQRYEDQIKQAVTLAEILAIEPIFTLEMTNA